MFFSRGLTTFTLISLYVACFHCTAQIVHADSNCSLSRIVTGNSNQTIRSTFLIFVYCRFVVTRDQLTWRTHFASPNRVLTGSFRVDALSKVTRDRPLATWVRVWCDHGLLRFVRDSRPADLATQPTVLTSLPQAQWSLGSFDLMLYVRNHEILLGVCVRVT